MKRFLVSTGLRIAAGGGFLQSVSWLYGRDDLVHAWLAGHAGLVTIGLVTYIGASGMIYDAERRLQEKRYRGKLRGAAIRPPRVLPRRNRRK